MRIGLDCRMILNPGFGEEAGVGHYTYFLVQHLLAIDQKNEYLLFFDRRARPIAEEIIGRQPRARARYFPFHEYRHYLPFIYAHLLAASFLSREKCDLFHSPAGILPWGYQAPAVITVHDLAIFAHPEWFPERILERFSSTRILLPRSVKKAKRIITPSESTARDLQSLFSVSGKIRIIPHGVLRSTIHGELSAAADLQARYHLADRYLLFLGTMEPRKNVAALVRAFRVLQTDQRFQDVQLVIAGRRGWKFEEIFQEIKETNRRSAPRQSVRYLGYVPAADKFALMKQTTAFVFPSLYEGFGLPVLEAMSLGAPVITSNVSSLPEVVGRAALMVDPADESSLATALGRVLEDEALRRQLSQAGRLRAQEFSWTKTAAQTLQVYQECFSA